MLLTRTCWGKSYKTEQPAQRIYGPAVLILFFLSLEHPKYHINGTLDPIACAVDAEIIIHRFPPLKHRIELKVSDMLFIKPV